MRPDPEQSSGGQDVVRRSQERPAAPSSHPSEVMGPESPDERRFGFMLEHFSGSLPHPEHFTQYARIIPDGANRLMATAEREQQHRHDAEMRELEHQFELRKIDLQNRRDVDMEAVKASREEIRGDQFVRLATLICVAFVSLLLIGGAVLLGLNGKTDESKACVVALGVIFAGSWIASVVNRVSSGKRPEKEEQAKDAED